MLFIFLSPKSEHAIVNSTNDNIMRYFFRPASSVIPKKRWENRILVNHGQSLLILIGLIIQLWKADRMFKIMTQPQCCIIFLFVYGTMAAHHRLRWIPPQSFIVFGKSICYTSDIGFSHPVLALITMPIIPPPKILTSFPPLYIFS